MFEKSKKANYVDSLGRTNRIVEGTVIKGNIEAVADLRLDGILEGDLIVKGRVVLGPTAKVIGNIECENSDIEGVVEGKIKVSDLLHLKSSALIKGELTVGRLSVEPGAKIEVNCQMRGTE
jgi:cytoskeletal protein CcmA (bactofilin family)